MEASMLVFLLGCNGADDTGKDSPDDDTRPDEEPECEEDGDCDDGEICESESCQEGDRNNSVEEAEPILWEETREGVINPAGDVDYFTFSAEGGEWIRVQTVVDGEDYDTFVTIRDPVGKVVTSADAFATGTGVTGTDAVAFAYCETAGAYTITVEDVDHADGGDGFADPDYVYALTLQEWTEATRESDSAEDPGYDLALDDERIWLSVGALIETAGDQDFVALDHGLGTMNLFLDGNQDLTGSDLYPRVRLLGTDGTVWGDKENVGPDDYLLYPHLPLGDYVVEVTDAGGGGGANAWTFLHVIVRDDEDGKEFTEETEPNEDTATVTALPVLDFENGNGDAYTQSFGQGAIDGPDDVDWYTITTELDGGMVFCLSSAAHGSLVLPTIELYDAAGNLLREETADTGTPNLNLDNVDIDAASYFLKVTAPDAEGGPGSWYRFHWYTASFQVSDYADGGYSCP